MLVSPAETIDTVNVSTSNFDAEQGSAGGAAITVITKSGTNEFKGSAFAFYNNQNLNAKPYFATEKSDTSAHIDGATLGGPIMKNKLFFFGAWEGQYQTHAAAVLLQRAARRAAGRRFQPGVQSRWLAAGHLRPADRQSRRIGRLPFPGNVIPADRISDIAKQIQALYPDPNNAGTLTSGNVGGRGDLRNFVREMPRKFDRNNYDFKVNWNPSAAAQVWGKYSRLDATVLVAHGVSRLRRHNNWRHESESVHVRRRRGR